MKLRWLTGKALFKIVSLLMIMILLFSVLFCIFYMKHRLEKMIASLETRVQQTSELVSYRFKSMLLSSFNIFSDMRVFHWITSQEANGSDDINMMSAINSYLRTDMQLSAIVLYNREINCLYVSGVRIYRNPMSYPEEEVLQLLDENNVEVYFRFSPITFENRSSIALTLPNTLYSSETNNGLVIAIYDSNVVADSVTLMFKETDALGVDLFVVPEGGMEAILGTVPDHFVAEEDIQSSVPHLLSFVFGNQPLVATRSIPLLGWKVVGIISQDSFFLDNIPFIRVILILLLLLFLVLTVFIVFYGHMLNRPYIQLAATLNNVFYEEKELPAPEADDNLVLSSIQSGVNYLIQRIMAQSRLQNMTGMESRLISWGNALGTSRHIQLDFETYFSTPYVMMGLAVIDHFPTISEDFFERRMVKQNVYDMILMNIHEDNERRYCINNGDGSFLLLFSMADEEDERVLKTLDGLSVTINKSLQVKLRISYAVIERDELADPGDIYAKLFYAAFTDNRCLGSIVRLNHGTIDAEYLKTMDCQFIDQMIQHIHNKNKPGFASILNIFFSMNEMRSHEAQKNSLRLMGEKLLEKLPDEMAAGQKESIIGILESYEEDDNLHDAILGICEPLFESGKTNGTSKSRWQNAMLDICEYIHDNLSDPQLSVEMIAEKEGYSPNYIRSMFKTYMGISLSDYIRQEKIALSCMLLRNENLTIAEIVTRCGFSNRSSFFTIFKKAIGMTPAEFRSKEDA